MIQKRTHLRRLLFPALLGTPLAFCLALVFALPACGEGFRILDQSASATAQGSAFAAQADDPSAVYYNPAAMADLPGLQMTAGTLLVNGNIDFTPQSGQPIKGDFGGTFADPPPSTFFVTARISHPDFMVDSVALGLGVYAPFGNITSYPTDSAIAPVLTRAASPIIDLTPTLAFRLNPAFALGGGLDIYTFSGLFGAGQVELQQTADDLVGLGSIVDGISFGAGDEVELTGDDTALGYHASLLWTPLRNTREQPLVNVAVVYHSQATLNLTGQLLNKSTGMAVGAAADLPLPQVITLGVATWPLRDAQREWKVETDLDYADWTSFDNLDVTLANGAMLPRPRNWERSYVVKAGTEYKWMEPEWLPHWNVAVRGRIRVYRQPGAGTNVRAGRAGLRLSCVLRRRWVAVSARRRLSGPDLVRGIGAWRAGRERDWF